VLDTKLVTMMVLARSMEVPSTCSSWGECRAGTATMAIAFPHFPPRFPPLLHTPHPGSLCAAVYRAYDPEDPCRTD
jgi:hypothetical protein